MLKLTLEFKTVDEAIVALGKLVGAPSAPLRAAAVEPQGPVTATPATRPGRKPRADKGQKRGEYAPRQPEADAAGAGAPKDTPLTATSGSEPAATPSAAPAAEASESRTAPKTAPAEGDKPQPSGVVPASGAVPSQEAVQTALERLFASKKVPAEGIALCQDVLSRFGVTRARDLKPEQRAEFIAKAEAVATGTEKP